MRRLTILHTNDIHGRDDGIARIATLVEQVRAETPHPVVYADAGDVEEPSRRLSNLTKGAAMHRLLTAAGCDVHAAGNATWLKYGPQEFPRHASVAGYPILLANFRTNEGGSVDGVQGSVLLDVGGIRLGVVGACEAMMMDEFDFGLTSIDEVEAVRRLADALRQDGAEVVLFLSHLGLPRDREIAVELAGSVDLIVGGHSHDLLPNGEHAGGIPIAQAGCYAEHLGRIELTIDGFVAVESMEVMPVPEETALHPAVITEAAAIEQEIESTLGAVIGQLAAPLDFAADRECRIANWLADVLRERMGAEVGLASPGADFDGPLAAGPLTRGDLWQACSSPGNPGVTVMTGEQLLTVVRRGLDPEFAAETNRSLRGAKRGFIHISGAELRNGTLVVGSKTLDPARSYRVAGGDWVLSHYGGYVEREWELAVEYHFPKLLRDALEEHLARNRHVEPPTPRLGNLILSETV